MARYMKLGTDLVVGGVGGAASKVVDDWDADRAVKAGKALTFFQRGATYLNFGVPLLGIVGSMAGFLHGDWETRVLTMGGTLAGREATVRIKEKGAVPWRPAHDEAGRMAADRAAAEAAARRGGGMGRSAWKPTGISAT